MAEERKVDINKEFDQRGQDSGFDSRVGEGDDAMANDQWNKKWEDKYWRHFSNELNGRSNRNGD